MKLLNKICDILKKMWDVLKQIICVILMLCTLISIPVIVTLMIAIPIWGMMLCNDFLIGKFLFFLLLLIEVFVVALRAHNNHIERAKKIYIGEKIPFKEKLPFYSIVGCLFFTFIVGFCAIFFDLKSISYKELSFASIVAIIIIILLFIIYGIYKELKIYFKYKKFRQVKALVVDIEEVTLKNEKTVLPVLSFTFNNQGYKVTGEGNRSYTIGDEVTVWINPDEPSDNHFDNLAALHIRNFITRTLELVGGILLLVLLELF